MHEIDLAYLRAKILSVIYVLLSVLENENHPKTTTSVAYQIVNGRSLMDGAQLFLNLANVTVVLFASLIKLQVG